MALASQTYGLCCNGGKSKRMVKKLNDQDEREKRQAAEPYMFEDVDNATHTLYKITNKKHNVERY